jgi:hypothetical protein
MMSRVEAEASIFSLATPRLVSTMQSRKKIRLSRAAIRLFLMQAAETRLLFDRA